MQFSGAVGGERTGLAGRLHRLQAAGPLVLLVVLPVNLVYEVSLDVLQLCGLPVVGAALLRVLQGAVQLRPGLGLGGEKNDLKFGAFRYDLLFVD